MCYTYTPIAERLRCIGKHRAISERSLSPTRAENKTTGTYFFLRRGSTTHRCWLSPQHTTALEPGCTSFSSRTARVPSVAIYYIHERSDWKMPPRMEHRAHNTTVDATRRRYVGWGCRTQHRTAQHSTITPLSLWPMQLLGLLPQLQSPYKPPPSPPAATASSTAAAAAPFPGPITPPPFVPKVGMVFIITRRRRSGSERGLGFRVRKGSSLFIGRKRRHQ